MKILHVVPTYFPALRYGGPIYSVHSLCRSLVESGHKVDVFTTSVDGGGDSNVPHGQPVDLDGVRVFYHRSRHLRRLYFSRELLALLRARISEYDVAHLHSVFLFPTWAAASAAARATVPYIVSPRGMLVRDLIAQRSSIIKTAWINLAERGNLAKAACIHLTSESERASLVELGLALAPTVVIPNGVDPPSPFASEDVSGDVSALVREGFDILSFGRIHWKKGLDRLIRAMADIPAAKALIAGHDEDGYSLELKRLAVECSVENRVLFLPRQISGADKETLFRAARLFVLPSISENFGNVIVEAMIRQLPVLVTEGVGAADIVKASGCGQVAEAAPYAFGSALSEMLESPMQLTAMGKMGEAYAREHLTWRGVAKRFEEQYHELSQRKK